MKNDDNEVKREPGGGEILEAWVEPAMEVRLVALVMGEASEFERAELEEAMAEEPELKLFYDRIRGADSLMGEMLAAGTEERDEAWRMAPERRAAVLERVRGGAVGKVDELVADAGGAAAVGRAGGKRGWIGNIGSIAAALVALLAIGGLFLPTGAGIKSSMMPITSAVRDRYYATAEDSVYLFDASEPDAEMQLAVPTAVPAGQEREYGASRFRSGPGDGGEDGAGSIRNEALFADTTDRASKIGSVRTERLARTATPMESVDAVDANTDFGLASEEFARAGVENESEATTWEVPRLASVPPPTEAPAKAARDEGRENQDFLLSEAKIAKPDGGMGGGGAAAGSYEERFGDETPDQGGWSKHSERGRSAGKEGFSRGAGEDSNAAVADARTGGVVGGLGGAAAAVDGWETRRDGEGLASREAAPDVDGDGLVELAKGMERKPGAASAAAGGPATSPFFAERDSGGGSGIDAISNPAVAAAKPNVALETMAEEAKNANGLFDKFAAAVAPAEMPGEAETAGGAEPWGAEDRSVEKVETESLSSRATSTRYARESAREKSRTSSSGEAVIAEGAVEQEEESAPVLRKMVPETSTGVVPMWEMSVAEGDPAGNRLDLEAGQVVNGEVGVRERYKSSEGQTKWFDGIDGQTAAHWGRAGGASEDVEKADGETSQKGVAAAGKLFGSNASGGVPAAKTPEPMTATRGEVPTSGPAGMTDESLRGVEPQALTGSAGVRFEANKKKAAPAPSEEGRGTVTDPTSLGTDLTRNSLSLSKEQAAVDFDVEVVALALAQAEQPATLSGYTVVDDVDQLAVADLGEGFAGGTKDADTTSYFSQPETVNFSVSGKAEVSHELLVMEQATTALETATAEEPFSTFSLHVSDVSFKLASAALLEAGTWPEPDQIRVEEFVNAFDYGDPGVTLEQKVGCKTEQAAHPFLQQRNLVRVSMRAAASGRSGGQPLRLTVLLDKSGSMEREDREAAVAKAMDALASHLTGDDVITVIGFARTPRLIADRMSGERAGELATLVAQAPSEGGTNLEQALQLGREVALRQHLEGGMNRIVLMTDGAANLGNARPEALSEMVVRLRNEGVAFDACGVGADGLNDEILEALTREGDGRYYFLNRAEDADEGFVKQLAGALRPAAKNVKVQVEFNPERVRGYRLLGFEKHRLEKEDFRNDTVDAAEMAAEEAGVAVYQTEVIPDGTGDVGKVWVRFQDTVTGEMVERSWGIPYVARVPRLSEAPAAMKLAGTAVLLGERLKGGAGGDLVDLAELAAIGAPLRQEFAGNQRVEKLIRMIEAARNLEQ